MSKKIYSVLGYPENHDEISMIITPEELKVRRGNVAALGLRPGDVVYIPPKEHRVTYVRSARAKGELNIPVVVVRVLRKMGDKFRFTGSEIEIGIETLFRLDFEGKPQETDQTCASLMHLPNNAMRLDALGGKVIQAGEKECRITVACYEPGQSFDFNKERRKFENGKLVVKEIRMVPSRILEDNEWQ